ncbi:MAG: AraC family transcriptional regulator [Spirochaetes bacterium]|nr:AraC family transcriptional regulator [Spirochaetota bacterium]
MEWYDRMNSAIDYIEQNLDYEISITEAAIEASCSSFHFQRMFFAIIGITPAEYIRRRRLTLAAADLSAGNAKVIDIALKYGYESPNAFTRAFRNMHGINPREVRTPGVKLSAYQRVSFHVEIKGGNDMDYRIIDKPAFDLIGKSKNFTNEDFFKKAPKFWKEYVCTEEYQELWSLTNGKWGAVTEAPLMSVYLPDEKGTRDSFTDILGMEKPAELSPDKFKVFRIPAATYAEFNCTYQTAAKMNKFIYGEWFSSTGYERDEEKADIAAYFPVAFMSDKGMGVRWWIPVIKK